MRLSDLLPSKLIADLAHAPVQARSYPVNGAQPLNVNLPGLFPGRFQQGNWFHPSVRQAMAVPAILRCLTLISNTAGALSMNGIREGVKVDAMDRPRLIVRPNPLTTPRVFHRDSTFWKASYGESWWWVAARDLDDYPLSLVPVPPYEVKVEEVNGDPLRPKIMWRNREMARRDMILDTLMPDPDNPYRGIGPLQLCGAAVSAAVESQTWAANFFSEGGYPSVWLKPEVPFEDEDQATKAKEKWITTPPNTPHILENFEPPGTLPVNEQGSQMLQSRVHNFGEAALMFGIPGRMVEYMQSGSSISYTNTGEIFDEFVKSCLWPNYLEGSEQVMTDLLPRTWVAEYDVTRFTRPDPKTQMEIHGLAITAGIYDAEYAQRQLGILPGSIETAPVPPAPPQAVPPLIDLRTAVEQEQVRAAVPIGELRCDGLHVKKKAGIPSLERCGRLLSRSGVFVGRCPRCKKEYAATVAA